MINYCLEYTHTQTGESYTSIYDSEEERSQVVIDLRSSRNYSEINTYENEECYCHAYSENECACGNFR